MTQTTLTTTLLELRRRLLAIEAGAGAVWTAIAAIAAMLAWMWLDVMLELSSGLRVAAWLLAALPTGAVVIFIGRSVGRRCDAHSLARRLDAAADAGGQIFTGVELMTELQAAARGSSDPRLAGAVTVGLAEMAVDRAAVLAKTVSAAQSVSSRPLRRPVWILTLIIVCVGAVSSLSPRLAGTQWLRFVDPYGDHPPYSRIWFDVQPGTARIIYGEGLDIIVHPRGGTPERIDLVLQAADSADVETLPMFPESGGSWRVSIASLTRPQHYYVHAARARSRRYDIGVQTVPRLEAVRVKVTPPAYAHKASYEGSLPAGGLAGLPRTRIQVWARSNRPLSGGHIVVEAPSTAPGTAPAADSPPMNLERTADPNEVTGTVTLHASGRLAIRVVDVDGQSSPQAFTTPVTLIPDERPLIRLSAPPAESLATPTAVIPISLAAEDDCGITRVQLFRSLNDSRPLPVDVPLPSVTPGRWSGTVELRLASYGLQPGDAIKLFARVEDNDPDGAKGGESIVATVRIIAQADFERLVGIQAGMEVMLTKYQQADRRVESLLAEIEKLRKELEALPKDGELSEAQRNKLKSLMDRLKEASEAIQDAARTKLPYDVDQALNPKLADLARKLAEAMNTLESAASKPGVSVAQAMEALEQAASKCAGGRKAFDTEATEPLEHLAAIYPLLEDQARFVALYERQRELTARLAAMKDHDQETDPAAKGRMRDCEVEQKQLHDALGELLGDIDDHVAKLPDDRRLDDLRETARRFAEDVRGSRVLPAMSEARSALASFAGSQSYRAANEATETMAGFLGRCQSLGQSGQMCLKFQPTLSGSMGNTIEEMLNEAGSALKGRQGAGAGSGYSAPRSTARNVGMYGGLSNPTNTARGGSLPGRLVETAGAGQEGAGPYSASPGGSPDADSVTGGAGSPEVPVQYRRKVGQYFERIADEMPDHRLPGGRLVRRLGRGPGGPAQPGWGRGDPPQGRRPPPGRSLRPGRPPADPHPARVLRPRSGRGGPGARGGWHRVSRGVDDSGGRSRNGWNLRGFP